MVALAHGALRADIPTAAGPAWLADPRRPSSGARLMRALIRHAGLRPDQEQRLRLAATALAAHGIQASVASWDGTRCQVAVVNADDAYGRKVLDVALRRGALALALSQSAVQAGAHAAARDDSSAASLARLLQGILQADGTAGPADPPAIAARRLAANQAIASDGGLVHLAREDRLAGLDLEAHLGGRVVHLARSSGRVLSPTLSDLMAARDRLWEPGWTFVPLAQASTAQARFEMSTGLDAFLLQGALKRAAQLPAFPDAPCRLDDWPDLGASPDAVDALRVVRAIFGKPATPSGIARALGLEADYVSACLWAFAAAGLLRNHEGPAAAVKPDAPVRGMWARLATHFGLRRPG